MSLLLLSTMSSRRERSGPPIWEVSRYILVSRCKADDQVKHRLLISPRLSSTSVWRRFLADYIYMEMGILVLMNAYLVEVLLTRNADTNVRAALI